MLQVVQAHVEQLELVLLVYRVLQEPQVLKAPLDIKALLVLVLLV